MKSYKIRRYLLDYLNSIWKFFTTIKLSVILLLSLAVTSIVGTLIPQNESPAAYFQEYGEFLYRIFDVFDFFDMYNSWWFQLLIVLLTVNIVVCSIDRLKATGKIVFAKNPIFNLSRFRNHADKESIVDDRSPEQLKDIYEPFVSKGFGYMRSEQTDKGFCIFAEKWRWTRLGVYGVHLSIVLLLVGSLIGSIFGFDGYVNIPEGEAVNSIRIRNSAQAKSLDFEVLCEDFDVSFYDSGVPKEFRSSLTILEHGKPVLKKDIIVNDPLRYKGINMFQSSYGPLPPKEVTLSFKSTKTGKVYQKKVLIGQQIDIPEAGGKFVVKDYDNAYNFRGRSIGEAFSGILIPENGRPIEILLPVRFPDFDQGRKGNVAVSVRDYDRRYYTGLQVTKDPGVWVVYSGFILLIVGCYITFFMSHQRLCIDIVKKGKKSIVMVAGTANKNKLGVPNRIKKISEKLTKLA
ncbi:MAG: cytochrome c biogenesis protein ResB [Desulfobacterales bacterium]|uniref:Cytochrome c biogenesis protein ResB n=1 Tax=Candidatus Desulfatibia vada TaxID=2841696 RepID=A0A8J6NVX3_9BACT|nr:cytochrome c biogenesis protein ResB [Candidatus Desulfatibia vada]